MIRAVISFGILMAHSNKQQPDFSSNSSSQDGQKQQAIARDIDDLHNGLKVDFDQKLGEISDLLARFKALVIAPSKTKSASNDPGLDQSQDDTADQLNNSDHDCLAEEELTATVTPLFNTTADTPSAAVAPAATNPQEPVDNAAKASVVSVTRYSSEPARFENGLYKLNCQLYRFRLELDQEMEFREEPLHLHFSRESDLSKVFQQLSDKSSEKHPDN